MALSLDDVKAGGQGRAVRYRPWRDPEPALDQVVVRLPLALVAPASRQARSPVDASTPAIAELAESIRAHGILQPITVYREGEVYRIVLGERRYCAARIAGLDVIPALVLPLAPTAQETRERQLIENLQREDMSPFDEGRAYRDLHESCALTLEEIGKRVGKSKAHVSKAISIATLPEDIQRLVSTSKQNEAPRFEHLFEVAKCDSPAEQRELLTHILATQPTVRELREVVRDRERDREQPNEEPGRAREKQAPMLASRQFRDPAGRFWATLHFADKNPSLAEVERALEKMLADVRRARARAGA